MIHSVKQTILDQMVEDIKALGLDKVPIYHHSTDFTKGYILTVYDDNRDEDVAIGTIKDFWLPELFSFAPELALEVKELRAWKKLVSDIVQQHDGKHLREMLKEMLE